MIWICYKSYLRLVGYEFGIMYLYGRKIKLREKGKKINEEQWVNKSISIRFTVQSQLMNNIYFVAINTPEGLLPSKTPQ